MKIKWLKPSQLRAAFSGDFVVSQKGTLSIAEVKDEKDKPFVLMSIYGLWETPNKYAPDSFYKLYSMARSVALCHSYRLLVK